MKTTVRVDNDTIKNMPGASDSAVIVAAPGTGKILIPYMAVVVTHIVSAYTNFTPGNHDLRVSFDAGAAGSFAAAWLHDIQLDDADSFFTLTTNWLIHPTNGDIGPSAGWRYVGLFDSHILNKGIYIDFNNTNGNFTGGNAANYMDVTVYYDTLTL